MADTTAPRAERALVIRRLHELITALDLRVPHIERAGEIAIARDAAALRRQAMERLAQLEAAGRD